MSFRSCLAVLLLVAASLLLSLCHLPIITAQSSQLAAPVITSLSGCPVSTVDNTTLLCTPPFLLTVNGVGLSSYSVINISGFMCDAYTVTTDGSTIRCNFLNSYTAIIGGYNVNVPVTVLDLGTHLTSNTLTSLQVLAIQPVVLSSISGCDGSGAATNNCNLNTSIVTIRGSGFTMADTQRWYLVVAGTTSQQTLSVTTDFRGTGTYPMADSNTIVLSLSYVLSVWQYYNAAAFSAALPNNSTTGTMALCFTHGDTASNCLALSYAYAPSNQALPVPAPTAGFIVNSSLSVLMVTGCPTNYANNGSTAGCGTTNSYRALTMVGTNFPPTSQLYVTVGGVRCVSVSTNSAGVSCSMPPEYTALQFDQWLPVVVTDMIGLQQSPHAYLVRFTRNPYPTLSSVGGCSGDGTSGGALSTAGCNISSVLTLVGSGFVANGYQWQISVNLPGVSVYQPSAYTIITSYINDTNTIVLPVAFLYQLIGPSVTSLSSTVTLYVQHGAQLVGPATITITTPPLSVSGVSGCAAPSNANFTVVGCSPGVSVLTIQGVSFSSVTTVTVGTQQPCNLIQYTSTTLKCVLPTLFGLQPGVGYDLTISNFAGNITLPGAVTYTSSPTIVSVTSPFCPPDYTWLSTSPAPLYCSAYAQLTLVGVYFQDLSTLTVNISSSSTQLPPLTCGNLSYQSPSELTCTLPAPTGQFAVLRPHAIQIWENSTFASNRFATTLYTDSGSQPNIVSVQGCASVDAVTRVASGCAVGDVITLNGAWFSALSYDTQVQLYSQGEVFLCSSPRVLSASQMTCVLPYLPLLAVDSVVPIRISNMGYQQSNWLVAINYNPATTASSSSSSGDTKFVISLAVLLPVVAILLVVLGAVLLMKRVGGGGSDKQNGDEQRTQGGRQGWSRQSDEKEESSLQMSGVSVDMYNNSVEQ